MIIFESTRKRRCIFTIPIHKCFASHQSILTAIIYSPVDLAVSKITDNSPCCCGCCTHCILLQFTKDCCDRDNPETSVAAKDIRDTKRNRRSKGLRSLAPCCRSLPLHGFERTKEENTIHGNACKCTRATHARVSSMAGLRMYVPSIKSTIHIIRSYHNNII